MLPTAASKQDCPHGSCKAVGLRREKFLSLTTANGLQADWQLQSTQLCFCWPRTSGTVLGAGEEKRQNKSASIYFCTADPSAPLHSWQGLELSLDPPNKSLIMRHGNPPALSTPFGLHCPGTGYFGHHRWFLHLTEHRDGASRCLTTTLLSHSTRGKRSSAKALMSPLDLGGWDTKGRVQRMGFTGVTEQNFHPHWHWELLLRQESRAELIRVSALSKALIHPTSRPKIFIPQTPYPSCSVWAKQKPHFLSSPLCPGSNPSLCGVAQHLLAAVGESSKLWVSPDTQAAESSPSLSFLCYLIAWMLFPVFIFLVCLAGLEGLTCWKTAVTSLSAALAKG